MAEAEVSPKSARCPGAIARFQDLTPAQALIYVIDGIRSSDWTHDARRPTFGGEGKEDGDAQAEGYQGVPARERLRSDAELQRLRNRPRRAAWSARLRGEGEGARPHQPGPAGRRAQLPAAARPGVSQGASRARSEEH